MRYIISFGLSIFPMLALADVPRVVADIPPIHALTAQVMGDLGSPVLLLAKGADEHDFQLRPSQMGDIADADLAVWIGPELTPWLERALAGGSAQSLALLDHSGTMVRAYGAADAGHEAHADAETHADTETHAEPDAHEGHDNHSGEDPHAWMDPANAAAWLDIIAASLAGLDPEHAAIYAANAVTAKAEIAAMDAEIGAALAPLRSKGFVTYHDAYGYFVAHYGLQFDGAIAMGDAATAGAAHVAALQEKIAGGTVCVFPEVQHDSTLLLKLLDGTGARVGGALDPVGSTLGAGAGAYGVLMRGIAKTLLDCLSGA